jgi:hypothetical protein
MMKTNIQKIYMDRYGVDNVRGGSYASVKLDDATINHLSQMSNGTNDKCFTCGKSGHFARDCNKKIEEDYVWCCSHCHKEFESERKASEHENKCNKPDGKCNCPSSYFSPHRKSRCFLKEMIEESESEEEGSDSDDDIQCCYRCGREGHYSNTCYASKHIKGLLFKIKFIIYLSPRVLIHFLSICIVCSLVSCGTILIIHLDFFP